MAVVVGLVLVNGCCNNEILYFQLQFANIWFYLRTRNKERSASAREKRKKETDSKGNHFSYQILLLVKRQKIFVEFQLKGNCYENKNSYLFNFHRRRTRLIEWSTRYICCSPSVFAYIHVSLLLFLFLFFFFNELIRMPIKGKFEP